MMNSIRVSVIGLQAVFPIQSEAIPYACMFHDDIYKRRRLRSILQSNPVHTVVIRGPSSIEYWVAGIPYSTQARVSPVRTITFCQNHALANTRRVGQGLRGVHSCIPSTP